ncbi:VOC family protein [Undibacterium sp. Ji83W]|uniref:VOC family protein n=1 Tax=Undibacterium sp. Ji83W TaxID=3413043 RepID=UPI003BF2F2BE
MSHLPNPGAVIYAKDLSKLSCFYEQVLQLTATHADDDYTILELPHFHLVIHAIPAQIASTFEISTPPQRRADTAIKLMLPVASISKARDAAVSLGGQIDGANYEWEFQHYRICDGHDPEGNVIQIREFLPR